MGEYFMKTFLRNIFIVAIISFVFHYAWEYIQCGIFYTMDGNTPDFSLMASATFGDVMMSIVLYVLLALVNYDINWLTKKWEIKEYIIIALYALFLSFYFEVSALYTNRWGYNDTMPLFPNTNIGLVPVIQLLVLFPLSFFISKMIMKRLDGRRIF
jgi:hypothetical protein